MGDMVSLGGVMLPRYDCPPEFQKFVPEPEDYEPQGDELRAIAVAAKYRRPLYLQGPTGCGKNAALRYAASLLNRPLLLLSLAEGTGLDQLIGVMVPQGLDGGGFTVVWSDGAFPRAIRMAAWLVLDELNAADERTMMRVHDFTAKGDRLFMYENALMGDSFLSPVNDKGQHNGFGLFATGNPSDTGMYTGVKTLNAATVDRFLVHEMDYIGLRLPDKEAEAIARQAKVKLSRARRIVDVMNLIRKRSQMSDDDLAKTGSHPLYVTASTRRAIYVALLSKDMPMMDAVKLGYLDSINKDDRPVVEKLFSDQFASEGE